MDGKDYDYIFSVLQQDIIAGDIKAPEPPRWRESQELRIIRDDTYRIVEHPKLVMKNLMVVKILKKDKVEFHLGLNFFHQGTFAGLQVGCFDSGKKLTGYGLVICFQLATEERLLSIDEGYWRVDYHIDFEMDRSSYKFYC